MSLFKWMLGGFMIDLFLATQDKDPPVLLEYSPEEKRLIAEALRSSKKFQELASQPGMTPTKISDILNLHTCTPEEFEASTGVRWPLKR